MIGRGVLALLVLVDPAHAEDGVAPDPADSPSFVILKRFDATSRIGIDYTYIDHRNAKPISRGFLRAHYIEQHTRIGGYVELPYTRQRYEATTGEVETQDVFGHFSLGALWLPSLPSTSVALVLHAGVALPVDDVEPRRAYSYLLDLAPRGALVSPQDIHASFPDATALRVGASALLRDRFLFSRVDVGFDASGARASRRGEADSYPATSSVIVNGAVGVESRAGLLFAIELSTITRVSEAPYEIFRSARFDDTNLLGTFALSIGFRRGPVRVHAASLHPLREPQKAYVRSGLTFGVEYALP